MTCDEALTLLPTLVAAVRRGLGGEGTIGELREAEAALDRIERRWPGIRGPRRGLALVDAQDRAGAAQLAR